MKLYNQTTQYEYDWASVTLAMWQKYPNPFATHVVGSDVIDRHLDEHGHLVTTRLFLKKSKIPEWGRLLISSTNAYILETSTVDPAASRMAITTRNLSHRKLMLVEENAVIQRLAGGNTEMRICVRFVSNTSFTWLRPRIEKFGKSAFIKNAENTTKGLLHVLQTFGKIEMVIQ